MIKTKNKKKNCSNIFVELRKKYGRKLDSVRGLQEIQEKILDEKDGKIINDKIYHYVNERCQRKIIEYESLQIDVRIYRERQDKIEIKADRLNNPRSYMKKFEPSRKTSERLREYRIDFRELDMARSIR